MIDTLIIITSMLLLAYSIYRVSKYIYYKAKELIKIIPKQQTQLSNKEVTEEVPLPEPVYQLQTHKIQYWLYVPNRDLKSDLIFLYKNVVQENLWINEPFHSAFYKILLILNQNEFMIIDSSSKIITMNLRDKHNQMSTSKSFQVFATKNIVQTSIRVAMNNILRFNKSDAQNILIAICIIALEKSLHYLSKEVPKNAIKNLLQDYEHADDVKYIISLIKEKNQMLKFVQIAFKEAFEITKTDVYNDSEVPRPLLLPNELPEKYLQEI